MSSVPALGTDDWIHDQPDAAGLKHDDWFRDQPDEINCTLSIPWLILSLVISIILARFAKGSMCSYLFMSMAWLYIIVLMTQSQRKMQRSGKLIVCALGATLLGWIIGTCVIWRGTCGKIGFFERAD